MGHWKDWIVSKVYTAVIEIPYEGIYQESMRCFSSRKKANEFIEKKYAAECKKGYGNNWIIIERSMNEE